MEAANRGAHEAGGRSVGLGISLPFEQEAATLTHARLDLEFHVPLRPEILVPRPRQGLVAFPGGFGTFDELFEMLTLIQTRKTKKQFPILLFGSSLPEERGQPGDLPGRAWSRRGLNFYALRRLREGGA
jgi:predicted Rossmann-fold nucleotide-binding protein